MTDPHMNSPAPAMASEGRANSDRLSNSSEFTTNPVTVPPDFAARYVANRFRLPLPIAAMVANLAGFGAREVRP